MKLIEKVKDFISYYDGMYKPKLTANTLREKFNACTFEPCTEYGTYKNFGKAYEQKVLDLIVVCEEKEYYLVYREYGDANENTCYFA